MPNALRSIVQLSVGDLTLTLKPTFDVLATLENELDRSIFAIVQDLSNPRKAKFGDVAKVIYVASGKMYKLSVIGEALQAGGITEVLPKVFDFLTKSISTDEDLQKAKEKAETETLPTVSAEPKDPLP
jgi:hypothetical protein